jgi:hypothetical protein
MKNHLLYIGTILCLLFGYFLISNGVEVAGSICMIAFLLGLSDLLKELLLKNKE